MPKGKGRAEKLGHGPQSALPADISRALSVLSKICPKPPKRSAASLVARRDVKEAVLELVQAIQGAPPHRIAFMSAVVSFEDVAKSLEARSNLKDVRSQCRNLQRSMRSTDGSTRGASLAKKVLQHVSRIKSHRGAPIFAMPCVEPLSTAGLHAWRPYSSALQATKMARMLRGWMKNGRSERSLCNILRKLDELLDAATAHLVAPALVREGHACSILLGLCPRHGMDLPPKYQAEMVVPDEDLSVETLGGTLGELVDLVRDTLDRAPTGAPVTPPCPLRDSWTRTEYRLLEMLHHDHFTLEALARQAGLRFSTARDALKLNSRRCFSARTASSVSLV